MNKWAQKVQNLENEEVGKRLRKMMPWMEAKEAPKF